MRDMIPRSFERFYMRGEGQRFNSHMQRDEDKTSKYARNQTGFFTHSIPFDSQARLSYRLRDFKPIVSALFSLIASCVPMHILFGAACTRIPS